MKSLALILLTALISTQVYANGACPITSAQEFLTRAQELTMQIDQLAVEKQKAIGEYSMDPQSRYQTLRRTLQLATDSEAALIKTAGSFVCRNMLLNIVEVLKSPIGYVGYECTYTNLREFTALRKVWKVRSIIGDKLLHSLQYAPRGYDYEFNSFRDKVASYLNGPLEFYAMAGTDVCQALQLR